MNMQEMFVFTNDDYCAELRRELEMRRNVWARIPGKDVVFVKHEHQKCYDRMVEILVFLETLGFKRVEMLQRTIVRDLTPPPTLFDM